MWLALVWGMLGPAHASTGQIGGTVTDRNGNPLARARIEEAERRVLAGEEFAAVAREVSDDMSKANGGDFGWIAPEVIPAQFLGRGWAIEPGETR